MRVTDQIVSFFESNGIEDVFGFPCEQMEPYYASLANSEIRHVLARSEASAAIMADGYARASFSLGVCDGVGGPGTTNIAVGLIEAYGASSPVLALTGDNSRHYRGNEVIQDADNLAILEEFTKGQYDPETPQRAVEAVRNAVRESLTGVPKPTHVNLTEDVLEGSIDTDGSPVTGREDGIRYPSLRPEPSSEQIEKILEILRSAERPVILSGEGALRSQAWDEIAELARLTATPIVTSMNGKGIVDESSSRSLGVVGRWGFCQVANDAVERCDALLVLGARMGELTTVGWSLVPEDAEIIHVDLDPSWLGKNYDTKVNVLADIRATVKQILGRIDEDGFSKNTEHLEELSQEREEWRESYSEDFESDRSPIDPHRVVHAIQETVPEDTVLVSSTSFPGFMTAAFYEVRNPGIGYIQARGSDGINYCLPQALGVQVAEPERNIVAVTGDGGIGYHIADLETATREDLPLTVVVFNNQSLGSSKMSQMANWNVDVSTDFSSEMSYAQIAQGCGCHGEVIEEPGNLDNALDNAVKSDRPALLDVRIDPYVPPPLLV